jgi:hypothetical protein
MRVVSVAVLLLLLGCGERSVSTGTAAAAATPTPPVTAAPLAATFTDLAHRTAKMPAPAAMSDGGMRIDLRGTARHVRTLERQPDGKYRQACVAPPAALGTQGTK